MMTDIEQVQAHVRGALLSGSRIPIHHEREPRARGEVFRVHGVINTFTLPRGSGNRRVDLDYDGQGLLVDVLWERLADNMVRCVLYRSKAYGWCICPFSDLAPWPVTHGPYMFRVPLNVPTHWRP